MGNSTLSSNIVGKTGNEIIRNIDRVDTTTASHAVVKASSYMRVGPDKYIFDGGAEDFSASITAVATALVGASVSGSIYLGDTQLWFFDSDTTATKV